MKVFDHNPEEKYVGIQTGADFDPEQLRITMANSGVPGGYSDIYCQLVKQVYDLAQWAVANDVNPGLAVSAMTDLANMFVHEVAAGKGEQPNTIGQYLQIQVHAAKNYQGTQGRYTKSMAQATFDRTGPLVDPTSPPA